ncbi:hypothetical protein FNW02_18410 [Komarekiella sp. 'clone 1']|uniref:Uncharacterized protein n=1 Tax=Komarekiella delphini-convector SJRDD-AB1 TaxID=2593771 RepID=A0AA40SYP1_9NOST|nr:hypothetical protein [Komarekiella delphini-convector]MBD6617748.1 hypothetical protein [Komarekiella delphini-convector SJRDD-AB1]
MKHKPNVVFVSPSQKIQGTTGYKYFFLTEKQSELQSAIHQIVVGIPAKDEPACIKGIEKEITQKNSTRIMPYKFLLPSQILQSINI